MNVLRALEGRLRPIVERRSRLRVGHGGGSDRCAFPKVEVASERAFFPGRLPVSNPVQDGIANPREDLFHLQPRHLQRLHQRQGVRRVPAVPVHGRFTRTRRVGDQRACRRLHPGQTPQPGAKAALERIVPACIQNHHVQRVAGRLHASVHPPRRHRLEVQIRFLLDRCVERNQVVVLSRLNAVAGVAEQPHGVGPSKSPREWGTAGQATAIAPVAGTGRIASAGAGGVQGRPLQFSRAVIDWARRTRPMNPLRYPKGSSPRAPCASATTSP